jgi:hypothetical protein
MGRVRAVRWVAAGLEGVPGEVLEDVLQELLAVVSFIGGS